MDFVEAERYTCNVSPRIGMAGVGNLCRAYLIYWSAASATAVHWKLFYSIQTLSIWKSGIAFSADFDMKPLRAISFPFRPWASLRVFGDGASINS